MALPSYNVDEEAGGVPPVRKSSRKIVAVAAAVAVAMVACVALLALAISPDHSLQTRRGESDSLLAITPDHSLQELAMHMLKHADTMPESKMLNVLEAWRNNPDTMLNSMDPASEMRSHESARTEMLVGSLRSKVQILDASDSKLCAKKDIIIQKFDDLLRKLGGEELALNISLGKMSAQWKAAVEGWLDSESQYRLRIEQAKEAKQGSKFAEEEYEKYREAEKEAKENYESGVAKHDAERTELDGERALIKMIMRYIGVLHDVKATEKSVAAGGRDSVKDGETGVSDPHGTAGTDYTSKTQTLNEAWNKADDQKLEKTRAELQAKIKLLSQLATKTGLPGTSTKLAILVPKSSKLAVYQESVEVANILKEMLDDIATRRTIIDKVDVEAKNLLDTVTAKMVEWEGKLVALGNAKDKAKSLMDAAKLEREKLNGEKTVLGTAEKEGEAAAKVMIPPYEREIYVIAMIKKKILDHCNSGGRENTEQTN
eukprot:CAMPEP_0173075768 /NCGR_PEP_ID=MMETSP1102-20130122/11899_1 /TAXON_ID=49646 /ORGANISM="Geminigera sp., Strain Caron Lab Isolate" /LENGTH=486 /DNA_ID=CAMNT_0013945271 /DNA_START=186 /DNA_END=1646 /DNA_ORIENTATION=+